MATDKEIIDHLLNALERTLTDNAVLTTMIETYRQNLPEIGDWERDFEKLKSAKKREASKLFSQLRDAVARSRDIERALQRLLRIPYKGSIH